MIAPAPFVAGVAGDTPLTQTARTRLVEQVDDHSKELLRCYREALRYVPLMHGRVVLRLSVSAHGAIEDLRTIDNTTKFDAFGCCVASVVRQFTWPPSAAGASRTLDYPFTFELIHMPEGSRKYFEGEYYHTGVLPDGFVLHVDGLMYGDP